MNARVATTLLWVAVGLWLVLSAAVVVGAADGRPLLASPVNVVLFAALSTATVCLLVIRSHYGQAGRMGSLLAELRAELDKLSTRLDHRDGGMCRDFSRRLDHMTNWMTRPAIPRGPVRASATVQYLGEPTQPLPVVDDRFEAEIRGLLARENTDDN